MSNRRFNEEFHDMVRRGEVLDSQGNDLEDLWDIAYQLGYDAAEEDAEERIEQAHTQGYEEGYENGLDEI